MPQAVLSLLIALSLLSCCPFVRAAEPDGNVEKKDPVLIYRTAGVNEEQEAKIRILAREYEKEGRVRVERMRNLSKQMTELSFAPELDETKILSLQDEINELQNTLNKDRVKLLLKIRSLLTAEQKSKLVELLKEKDLQSRPAAKAVSEPAGKGSL